MSAEIADEGKTVLAYQDMLIAANKRIAELEAALTPFARYATADGLPDGFLRVPDGHPALFNGLGDNCRTVATIGDFRRASALLASSLPNKEDRNGDR